MLFMEKRYFSRSFDNRNRMDWSKVLVVELASVLAGPSVGQWLAELGARVIKVENPVTAGDVTRSWKLGTESQSEQTGAYFSAVNWGKESLGINLKKEGADLVITTILSQADIVLASFLPGQAESMGIEFEAIRKVNPAVIWADINGYGSDNDRPAYDAIIQAESGFTYMNGLGKNIAKMPVALMDVLAAHHLKEAILLAMIEKQSSGIGKRVQVSLIQSAISSLVNQATNWLVAGHLPQAVGSEHPNIVPYGTIFKTKDEKQVVLAVGNDGQFSRLCKILQEPVPTNFATNPLRVTNRDAVNHWLQANIRQFSQDEFLAQMEANHIPAGAVRNMQEVFDSPHATQVLLHGENKSGVRQMISDGINSRQDLTSPPGFHQQGVSLLEEFGFTTDQIHRLVHQGIIPSSYE